MRRPSSRRSSAPALLAVLVALALAAVGVQVLRGSPPVATPVMPGSFTGYAFDACEAPSQRAMDAWLTGSPYWAVGVYISGENRACPGQENLDAAWVATQAARGWRLLPLDVGPQAPCSHGRWSRIDAAPAGRYAAARRQGTAEADGAAGAAAALALAPGSTLWLDVEAFDISQTACRAATLAYVSGWSARLHRHGFVSGLYSSAASGVRMLQQAGRGAVLPRQVWVGEWNGRADAGAPPPVAAVTGRVHQYAGTHRETHGGVTLEVDSSFMEVGRGSVAAPGRLPCAAPRHPPRLHRGDRSRAVVALQCLLRHEGLLHGRPTGRLDAATARAVAGLRRARHLPTGGDVGRHTWTALLSTGSRPLLKYGATGDAVRRLQRSLDAVVGADLPLSGVFGDRTAAAVRRYQRADGLPETGVVTAAVWRSLQAGR